eukprot:m.458011 g.458011  ORF g.458011 m.458011 type:complete len:68 (-) comp21579_c2_seq2:189-392(-)
MPEDTSVAVTLRLSIDFRFIQRSRSHDNLSTPEKHRASFTAGFKNAPQSASLDDLRSPALGAPVVKR